MGASESYIADRLANSAVTAGARMRRYPNYPYRDILSSVEVLADFLTCMASLLAAYLIEVNLGEGVRYPVQRVLTLGAIQALVTVLLLKAGNGYGVCTSLLRIRETERTVRAATQTLLILIVVSVMFAPRLPWLAIAIDVLVMPVLLILQKQVIYSFAQKMHSKGVGCKRVVVYGAGATGRRMTTTLLHSPKLGLQPVAIWSDSSSVETECLSVLGYRRKPAISVRIEPLTASALRLLQCSLLIVASPQLSSGRMTEVEEVTKQAGISIAIVSEHLVHTNAAHTLVDVDGLLLASPQSHSRSWTHALFDRLLDLVGSTILLACLSPLFLIIGLLIRFSSPGPAFFVQRRVGYEGELFDMFKFRTMVLDAPRYAVSPAHSDDPRITRIGKFLRRLSLDELPQLINVLSGSMSLVGPRPEMPFIVAAYSDDQRQRLQVKPGITGLWQLSADRGCPIHENLEYDVYYMRHHSFFMNIAILIHTLFFAMGGGV